MTGRGDLALALVAAFGLHAAALSFGLGDIAGGGAGNAGEDRVTLQAAPAQLSALVQRWDDAPETADVAALVNPGLPDPAAAPPRDMAEPARVRQPIAPAEPELSAAPSRVEAAAPTPITAPDAPLPLLAPASERAPSTPQRLTALTPPSVPQTPPAFDTAPPSPDFAPALAERPRARPPAPSAAPAPKQTASGTGEAGTRGTTARASVPKLSAEARRAAANAWAAAIQRRIARHHIYPRGARAEGRVRVAMVILADGRLERVSIERSSGARELDAAALAAVKRAAPFPAAPHGLDDKWFNVGQWIAFERR